MEILILVPQCKKDMELIKKLYEDVRKYNKMYEEESYSFDTDNNIVVIKEAKISREISIRR